MSLEQVLLLVVAAPGVSFLLLGLMWLLGVHLRERLITRLTSAVFLVMVAASAYLGWAAFSQGLPPVHFNGGPWFKVGEYSFPLELVADAISLPLIALSSVLVGLVGVFSARYMHRESGFERFFLLLHLFAFGAMLIFAAGSFDLLVAGWELVGISSALLVAFFHQRRDPVRSSMHVFSVYRVGDIGLVLGVFVLHAASGNVDIPAAIQNPTAATLAGLLFLWAAAVKSAQVPFFGWLPRAMEGPTPSSAIFYGAISIHAGAYLLLRISPILHASPIASAAVISVGLVSALMGTLAHRVVADAKTSIAYAAMTQLGIIFVEIGLGLPRLALAHMIGHAIVRTLQFLRAPSMLHDYHRVHAAAGGNVGSTGEHFNHILPESLRLWAYRFSLDRGFYDAFVHRLAVAPVLALSRLLGSFEPGSAPPDPPRHDQTKTEVLEKTNV
jgi:NAD(P)H-quinone oxidoreductase subunit 5